MSSLYIYNIARLCGVINDGRQRLSGREMAVMEAIDDAYLYVRDGVIKDFGKASSAEGRRQRELCIQDGTLMVDAAGGMILPSFCDSHTHIVYAESREQEFVDKIRGLSYAEIARRGGGILNSADRLHELSEDELYDRAMVRVREIVSKGTGAVEIKSGYGLNTADELKILNVIKRISDETPLRVVSTFLGAHAVGRKFAGRQSDYVDLVVEEMIPEVGRRQLADYIDVFCDEGFFTPQETSRILEAGKKWGMIPKIHGQELADSGGVEVAVSHGALSVDHLESMTDADIEMLKGCDTMPTALPGTSFFLNMPFAPGRKIIDNGLPLAIASDYNPGSTPSGDMKFAVSLACIKMRLLPEEALNAATINGAYAMGLGKDYGSITRGKTANFFITSPIPSLDYIPYAYTTSVIRSVFLQGKEICTEAL